MTAGTFEFSYSAVEVKAIEDALGPKRCDPIMIILLEKDAEDYMNALDVSAHLPDKIHSREKREILLRELRNVRRLVRPSRRVAYLVERHNKLLDPKEILERMLGKLFVLRKINRSEITQQFALMVIDGLIKWHEQPGIDERMKEGKRTRKNRDDYLRNVVNYWAEAHQISVAQCQISESEGSPMRKFIQAATEPVLTRTGEHIGSKRIMQIVDQMRKEEFPPFASVTNDAE